MNSISRNARTCPRTRRADTHPAKGYEHDDDSHQAGATKLRDNSGADDDHEETWDGEEDVNQAHEESVELAAEVPRDDSDQGANRDATDLLR